MLLYPAMKRLQDGIPPAEPPYAPLTGIDLMESAFYEYANRHAVITIDNEICTNPLQVQPIQLIQSQFKPVRVDVAIPLNEFTAQQQAMFRQNLDSRAPAAAAPAALENPPWMLATPPPAAARGILPPHLQNSATPQLVSSKNLPPPARAGSGGE